MIIVRIWEGVGNQLFQYAYARSLKERGEEVYLDTQKAYDNSFRKAIGHSKRDNKIELFSITIPVANDETIEKYRYLKRETLIDKVVYHLAINDIWKYRFYEEKVQTYSPKSSSISGNYYVKGWFQSEKYFSSIQNTIRKEITLKQEPLIPDELYQYINSSKSVSLHVRRGDYEKIGMALPAAYYYKAMEAIEKFVKDPIYIVFSDDIEWVKRKIKNKELVFPSNFIELQDVEELVLMSRCSAHIISNSTFGWWGAWLDDNVDKHIMAPKIWYSGQRDIVPSTWTIIK